MPGGNGTLAPLVWQPVPGAPGAYLYPLIRKTDIISSNSYLIATSDIILLIDPGGLPEQAGQLVQVISECKKKQDRPVFVFLTHAHIDHFAGMLAVPAFLNPETVVFAVQERGAESLERGDAKMTQADLFDRTVPDMKVGLHLFPRTREADDGIPVPQAFPNGATVTVTYNRSGGKGTPPSARLEFGHGPAPEIYHTPGHSPDSICIRIGEMLFIGDILFAANPGVAGLFGWDRDALVRSLDGIRELIGIGGVAVVCPGHGHAIAAPDAVRMLSLVRADAEALSDIAELNRERAEHAAAFAEDCMEQINELFTIMAGRLYYVSYVMDELGEPAMAERLGALIPGNTVDGLLEAFTAFAEEHHRDKRVPIHLALKAGQIIARLERLFDKEELTRIIDPMLVERAGRLLSDYTVMLRGFNPPGEICACSIVPVIGATVTGLSVSSCPDDDLLSSADDDVAFISVLLSRIGTRPLLEDVASSLECEDQSLVVAVDREHFSDVVIYILEDIVGTGSDHVTIQVRQKGQHAVIAISGNMNAGAATEPKKTRRFLSSLCLRAGGILTYEEGSGMRRYLVRLGCADKGA